MTKKKFEWDSEHEIGAVQVNERERRVVKICSMNEKEYVSIVKEKWFKDQWNIVGNATFQADTFSEISIMVDNFTKEEAK